MQNHMQQNRCESALEEKSALYKSDQQMKCIPASLSISLPVVTELITNGPQHGS